MDKIITMINRYADRPIFMFFFVLAFVPILSATSCHPPPRSPSMDGTTLALPFPLADSSVGISEADIRLTWDERTEQSWFVFYQGMFYADFKLSFTGEEPAIVEIVMPMLSLPGRRSKPFPIGQFRASMDGSPLSSNSCIIPERIEYTESRNLVGIKTPSLANFINDAHIHICGKAYFPLTFEADEPAWLYTFKGEFPLELPEQAHVLGLRIAVYYDHERTTIVSPTHGAWTRYNRETGEIAANFWIFKCLSYNNEFDLLELLVIGEDTIRWKFELDFRLNFLDCEIKRLLSDELYVNVEVSDEETPRKFFQRLQSERIYQSQTMPSRFLRNSDYIMFRIDERLSNPSLLKYPHEHVARAAEDGFVSVRDIISAFNWGNIRIPEQPNLAVVEIPFQPGQERILSISFPVQSAMEWDNEKQQSLFHHTILTETAKYWDFFESLTVTAYHPARVLYSEFTDGFETFGSKSVLSQNFPNNNIHIGFWLDDRR